MKTLRINPQSYGVELNVEFMGETKLADVNMNWEGTEVQMCFTKEEVKKIANWFSDVYKKMEKDAK